MGVAEVGSGSGGARQALHVVFVVDASGSMSGERIGSLNWAARNAIPAMRDVAADHPSVDVLVRVCRFNDDVDWPVGTPMPVDRFVWANISPTGESRMGAALEAVASALAQADAAEGESLPPVIILLSDGMPSDDAGAGIAALDATELGRQAIRIPIAIGPDADIELLQRFIGSPSLKPLRADNAATLVRRMCWAATVPVTVASESRVGDKPEIPPGDKPPADQEGSLVW